MRGHHFRLVEHLAARCFSPMKPRSVIRGQPRARALELSSFGLRVLWVELLFLSVGIAALADLYDRCIGRGASRRNQQHGRNGRFARHANYALQTVELS